MAIYRLGKSEPSIDKVDSALRFAASDAANPSKISSISCLGGEGAALLLPSSCRRKEAQKGGDQYCEAGACGPI